MNKPFDAVLKQMLDDFGADWAIGLVPQYGSISTVLEAIDPDLSTVQATPDKVFRLANPAGLLHLEVQSSHDGELPDRLLYYNVLLQHRHQLPVHTLVILLRREANASNLTGVLTRSRPDGRECLRFEYDVVRLWELSADVLLSGGLGMAPLALLTDDAAHRLPELVRRLANRIEHEVPDPEMQGRLLIESFILTGLRYDKHETRPLFMGIQNMKESSTYQGILEEGMEKGLEKGLEKGRAEGRAEGIETLQTTLIAILERKFAAVPLGLEQQIKNTSDAKRLQSGAVVAAMAQTIADFEREFVLQ